MLSILLTVATPYSFLKHVYYSVLLQLKYVQQKNVYYSVLLQLKHVCYFVALQVGAAENLDSTRSQYVYVCVCV